MCRSVFTEYVVLCFIAGRTGNNASKQGGAGKIVQAESHLGERSVAETFEFIEGKKRGMGGSETSRKKTPTKDKEGTNPRMKKETSLAQLDLPPSPGPVSTTGSLSSVSLNATQFSSSGQR